MRFGLLVITDFICRAHKGERGLPGERGPPGFVSYMTFKLTMNLVFTGSRHSGFLFFWPIIIRFRLNLFMGLCKVFTVRLNGMEKRPAGRMVQVLRGFPGPVGTPENQGKGGTMVHKGPQDHEGQRALCVSNVNITA